VPTLGAMGLPVRIFGGIKGVAPHAIIGVSPVAPEMTQRRNAVVKHPYRKKADQPKTEHDQQKNRDGDRNHFGCLRSKTAQALGSFGGLNPANRFCDQFIQLGTVNQQVISGQIGVEHTVFTVGIDGQG
jgi:hypothetical protein